MSQGGKANRIPNWLRQMQGWQDTPEWLLNLIEQSSGLIALSGFAATGGPSPESVTEEEPTVLSSDQDTSDWLAELKEGGEPSSEPPALVVDEQDDWFASLSRETVDEAETSQSLQGVDIPDWLSGLEDEPSAAVESPEPTAQEGLPQWMAGLEDGASTVADLPEPSETEDILDRLAGIGEGTPPEPEEEAVPEWMAGLDDEPVTVVDLSEPFETENIPDWLTGIEAGTPPDEAPAAAETSEPADKEALPDWLAGIEAGTPPDGAPAAALEGESPNWLPDLEDAPLATAETSEPAEQEGLPEWLAGIEAGTPPDEAPAAALEGESPNWLPDLEDAPLAVAETSEPAEEEALPEWLASIEAGTPPDEAPAAALEADLPESLPALEDAPLAAAETSEPAEEEALPEWLAGIEADTPPDEAPAAALEADLPESLPALEDAPLAAAETPEPAEEEALPEWLAGIEADTPPDEAPAAALEADLPESLPALEDAPLAAAETSEPAEEEGLPDWLASIEEAVLPEGEPEASGESAPEWLANLEASSTGIELSGQSEVEGVPAWLADIQQDVLPKVEPSVMEDKEGGPEIGAAQQEAAPDVEEQDVDQEDAALEWLQNLGEVPLEDEPAAIKGVTGWLQDIEGGGVPTDDSDAEPPEQERTVEVTQGIEPEAIVEPEEVGTEPASEMSIPAWLQEELSPESTGQDTTIEGEPAVSAQTTTLGESLLDTPAWMHEMYSAEEGNEPAADELLLPSKEELATGEAPAWIDELRSEPDEPPEEELPVETSGPLAGLRGVLNPEPLLAIFPKSTYKPVPPITEADHAEARLIGQILAEPVSHPAPVPQSAGREIMASLGRWVLYLVLLAVILFAPLQTWVRTPEQLETMAFYNAIDELQSASEVLLVVDYDASLDGELTPQTRAIIWHLLDSNLRVVAVSLTPQGVTIVQDLFDDNPLAVAGKNYLNVGYMPAHPAALQAFVNSPLARSTTLDASQDLAGTPLGQTVSRFEDLDLIITVSGDQDHVRWWIEQVGSQTQIDILASVSMGIASYVQPYYSETGSGQIKGVLAGLGATSQYEALSGARFEPTAQPNYVVVANAQLLLALVVLVSGLGSLAGLLFKRPSAPVSRTPMGRSE